MAHTRSRNAQRKVRTRRVRAKISGTASRPRLSVFRGGTSCFVQLIDDERGVTLASASDRDLDAAAKKTVRVERAKILGAMIGKKAVEKGITSVVFDRGGYAYHGRVAAVADGAREAGLQF